MKAIGLQMALDLIHKMEKRGLITGLKTKTQSGWKTRQGEGNLKLYFQHSRGTYQCKYLPQPMVYTVCMYDVHNSICHIAYIAIVDICCLSVLVFRKLDNEI